jgi:TRAP-type C4-dicarboxylate transport system permease large subunit
MRKLTWKNFKESIASTLRSSIMVWMLIVGAMVFGRFLAITRMPFDVAEWVSQLAVPPVVILLAILFIFIIGGALMDAMGFLTIALPIFYPTVLALGYDPIWFAIVLCVVTSLGAITPPVGVNVFVVQGLTPTTPITTIFRGTSYFLIPYFVFIGLLILFPQIVTFIL